MILYDRIRNMSPEQMADFLIDFVYKHGGEDIRGRGRGGGISGVKWIMKQLFEDDEEENQ